jgi:hypothetical protein
MTAHARSIESDFFELGDADCSGDRLRVTPEEAETLVPAEEVEPFDPAREARKRFSAALVAATAVLCMPLFVLGLTTWFGRIAMLATAALVIFAAIRVRQGDLRIKEHRPQ